MSHFGVPHTVNHAASGALRRNGKAAMSRIDRSKSRSAGGKGFYIALALCLAAVGAIGYFTLIRPANVTIDDPTPPARQTERNDAQGTAPVLQPEPIEVPAVERSPPRSRRTCCRRWYPRWTAPPSRCSAPRN